MTGSPAWAAMRELAPTFRDDPAWIRDEAAAITQAIHRELPELGDDDELRAMTHTSTEAVVRLSIDTLLGDLDAEAVEPPPAALAYARELARRGISVDNLLRAYHVGARTWFERWAASVRETFADPKQASLALEGGASWSMTFVATLSRLLVARYSDERVRWLRSAAAVRAESVQALLAGDTRNPDTLERRLGYVLDRHHLALVLWSEAAADPSALEHAASGLAGALRSSRPLLVPLGGGLLAAWIGSSDRFDDGEITRLGLTEGAGVLAAVGAPGAGIEGFRRSHIEAMQARRIAQMAGAEPGSVTRYSAISLVALASADLGLARAFVETELGPLASSDEGWQTLATTLRTYLEEGSSPRRAARRLGVHENTVKNRVRAAAEALSRPIASRAPELLVALRLAPLLASNGPFAGHS